MSETLHSVLCKILHGENFADASGRQEMHAPAFFLSPQSVQVLSTPNEFYEEIIRNIKSSRQRISMAALYIGTGKMETKLLNILQNTMLEQPQIKVSLLFDYNRATRPDRVYRQQHQSSHSNCDNNDPLDVSAEFSSCAESLASKLFSKDECSQQIFDQLSVSLLRVPLSKPSSSAASIFEQFPPKLQEMMGVMHMKFFVFDDSVIMTGANLSTDYFTTRQVCVL